MLMNTKRFLSYFGTSVMALSLGICVGAMLEKMKDSTCCVIDEM